MQQRQLDAYAAFMAAATDCRSLLANVSYAIREHPRSDDTRQMVTDYNNRSAETRRFGALVRLLGPTPDVRDAATHLVEAQRSAFESMRDVPQDAAIEWPNDAPEPLQSALTELDMRIQRFAEAARRALGASS